MLDGYQTASKQRRRRAAFGDVFDDIVAIRQAGRLSASAAAQKRRRDFS